MQSGAWCDCIVNLSERKIPVNAVKTYGRLALLVLFSLVASLASPAALLGADGPLGLDVGNHVPPLQVTDLEGRTWRFDWPGQDDSVTVFFFFDITTAQGLYGMTVLDRMYRAAHDFGLDVVAVEAGGLDRNTVFKAYGRYLSVYPSPPYPIVHDADGELRRLFGAGAPTSAYLVQQHGVILEYRRDPGEAGWEALSARIGKVLHLPEGLLEGGAPESAGQESPDTPEAGGPILFPGERAPSFEITDHRGVTRSFSWTSGEEGMLILFAWEDPCPECIREILFLDRLYLRARDIGLPLEILAVAAGGLSPAGVAGVLERLQRVYPAPSFPFVTDEDSRLEGIFGWEKLPATFFLDGDGTLILHAEGFDESWTGEWLTFLEARIPGAEGVLIPALGP